MSFPQGIYAPTDDQISRQPPGFIVRRAIQPGSAAASQTITVWEGDQSKHLMIQTLNLRVSITPNAGSNTKLEILRLEALDIASGTLATVVWEDIWTGAPSGVGMANRVSYDTAGWILPLGGGAQSTTWDLSCLRDAIIPNGLSLRFVLGTAGGVPVNLGGTAHLIGVDMPVARVPR